MEWNEKWNGMERKFRFGIWKMSEWNEMEDFKNGIEDNLPYFCSVTSNIVTSERLIGHME